MRETRWPLVFVLLGLSGLMFASVISLMKIRLVNDFKTKSWLRCFNGSPYKSKSEEETSPYYQTAEQLHKVSPKGPFIFYEVGGAGGIF